MLLGFIMACARCGGVATKQCKGCRQVSYCGRECQAAHWAAHRTDCRRHQAEAQRGRKLIPEELTAAPGKPRCIVCGSGKGPPYPVVRSCSCSSERQYVHVQCLVDSAPSLGLYDDCACCQECFEPYCGELGLEVAWQLTKAAQVAKDLGVECTGLELVRRMHYRLHKDFSAAYDLVKPLFHVALAKLQEAFPDGAELVVHKTLVTMHEDMLREIDASDPRNVAEFVMSLENTLLYFLANLDAGGFSMAARAATSQIEALSQSSDETLRRLAAKRGLDALQWAENASGLDGRGKLMQERLKAAADTAQRQLP